MDGLIHRAWIDDLKLAILLRRFEFEAEHDGPARIGPASPRRWRLTRTTSAAGVPTAA